MCRRISCCPAASFTFPEPRNFCPIFASSRTRRGEVFLVSHGCYHPANDPEFKQFPPHCLKGSPGAEFVPEALAEKLVRVENDTSVRLPEDMFKYQQIILEKQTLDVFETRHADELVERLGNAAEY